MAVVIPFIAAWDGKALQRAGKDIRKTGSSIQATGRGISGVGKQLTAGVTVPLVAIGAFALKSAGDFGQANRMFQQQAGATDKRLDDMNRSFKNVYQNATQSAPEVAQAITIIGQRTGATGRSLDDLAIKSLNLNRMIGGDLKTQIENTQRAMANWNVGAKDQGSMMDYLYGVSQKTGIGFDQLTVGLQQFGGPMRAFHMNMKQGAWLLGTFEKAGVPVEATTKSLTFAFKKMAKDGVKDPVAELPKLIQKIKETKDPAKQAKLAFDYFGRSGVNMLDAIKRGKVDLSSFNNVVKRTGPDINETADKTMTFNQRMTETWHQLEAAAQPLGAVIVQLRNEFLPVIAQGVAFVQRLSAAFVAMPAGAKRALVIGAIIAASLGPALVIIGNLVTSVGGMISTFGQMVGALGGATGAAGGMYAMLGPVVTVLAAIAGAGALVVASFGGVGNMMREFSSMGAVFKAQFAELKTQLSAAGAAAMSAFAQIGAAIQPALKPIHDAIVGLAQEIMPTISRIVESFTFVWTLIAPVVVPILAGIFGAIAQIFGAILNLVRTVMALIRGDWKGAWEDIKAVGVALFSALVSLIRGIAPNLVATLAGTWAAIRSGAAAAWGGIKSTVTGLWSSLVSSVQSKVKEFVNIGTAIANGIRDGIRNAWDGLVSKLKGLVNLLPQAVKTLLGIHSPSRVFAEIGRNVAAGLAGGMDAGIGAVQSAAANLVNATIIPAGQQFAFSASGAGVASAGSAAGYQSAPIIQIAEGAIQINASSMTPAELEAVMLRVLTKLADATRRN